MNNLQSTELAGTHEIYEMEGMTIDQAKKWVLPFGKHKGSLISTVFVVDEQYIDWLHDTLDEDDKLKLAIELVCYTKEDY